jgi:hypothetical protein
MMPVTQVNRKVRRPDAGGARLCVRPLAIMLSTSRHTGSAARTCSGPKAAARLKGVLRMDRRTLLKLAATSPRLSTGLRPTKSSANPASALADATKRRVCPGDSSCRPDLFERISHMEAAI